MAADIDLAAPAALIAEPTRATFLTALAEAGALPAGELARRARVTPQTASEHLARLADGGLVRAEPHGRHRYFRLAGPAVAEALEALALLAPARPVRSLRDADRGAALRAARTCYDHLAGALGVAVAASFQKRRLIAGVDDGFAVTRKGERELAELGIDIGSLRAQRRQLTRPCLDWSERRYHLAGSVGAALTARLLELGWVERLAGTRALRVTEIGREGFRTRLGVDA